MNTYKRHRFPPEIISYAVWLYYRFNLSHRDIEDLLAERGITVSREAIRLWCIKSGVIYSRRLKRKHRGYGDTFYIDEVFIKINGKQGTDKLTSVKSEMSASPFRLPPCSILRTHFP
jgi:putative transposase